MKKIKVLVIIAVVSISLLTVGAVEVGGKSNTPGVEHKDARARSAEKDSRWDKGGKRRLIKEFGITEDQLIVIKELRKRQREEVKELRKRYHESFLNILTDEQRQKWDEKMRGNAPRLPIKHKLDRDVPVNESDKHRRVGKYSNDNVQKINISSQEITWGELKSNN